ncbi:GNAT family N-acetyltransferase [Vallicoccus soli]|uniref:GNAT family N-acetyltransferase n=1 Tax=Vallicoccus soli TaxID=2339232 RepID=UPI001C499D12|nr:GNAT family N-acetyltransferase [Vallicoccus soli]
MPPAPSPSVVRDLRPADLPWTAATHVRLLPHGLFPRLGGAFVRRWHLGHRTSPYGVALVAERDGRPVGFLVGAVDQRRHVAWTLEHERLALALRGVLGLALHPAVLAVFVRTRLVRYARRLLPLPAAPASGGGASRPATPASAPAGPAGEPAPVAVVAAVVVDPTARGTGAGRLLVEEFLARSAAAGTARAELVTLAGAGGASDFYAALGWQALEEHPNRDGELVRRFVASTRGGAPGTGTHLDLDRPAGERAGDRSAAGRQGAEGGGTWLEPTA